MDAVQAHHLHERERERLLCAAVSGTMIDHGGHWVPVQALDPTPTLCRDAAGTADTGGNRLKLLLRVLLLPHEVVTAKGSLQTVYYHLAINYSG